MGLFDGLIGMFQPSPDEVQANELRKGIPALEREKKIQKQMAEMYAKRYPYLAPLLDDPKFLMDFVDKTMDYNYGVRDGSWKDTRGVEAARGALRDIYKMPDYANPSKWMNWDEGTKNWVHRPGINPRDIR